MERDTKLCEHDIDPDDMRDWVMCRRCGESVPFVDLPMPALPNLPEASRMAERFRVSRGQRVRVPRRIAAGREQRPHPQTLRRQAEERRYCYAAPGPLGSAGGVFAVERMKAAFKRAYFDNRMEVLPPGYFHMPLPEFTAANGFTYATPEKANG
jgi:hypothetical protein